MNNIVEKFRAFVLTAVAGVIALGSAGVANAQPSAASVEIPVDVPGTVTAFTTVIAVAMLAVLGYKLGMVGLRKVTAWFASNSMANKA